METKLTEKESMQIINEMIAEARNNFSTAYSRNMLYMGYAVAGIALLNIVLLLALPTPSYSFFIWLLMFPISWINSYASNRELKSALVSTHVERVGVKVWGAFGICMMLFLANIFAMVFIYNNWIFTTAITPTILLLTGFGEYITGALYKTKAYITGAYVFWMGTIACVISMLSDHYVYLQFLVLAACMILGFVLPTLQLKRQEAKNV